MKTLLAISCVAGLLLTCCVGCAAALLGLRRLDRWCQRQLTDTDGQPESIRNPQSAIRN
jgi:hypothetical protein